VAAATAKTAAIPTKGVARRTRLCVRNGTPSVRGRDPGNTLYASPPLAGWMVRRTQSLRAPGPARPPLSNGFHGLNEPGSMRTPLRVDGLARRVYPFLGLAIVGLVSLRGLATV